MSDVDRQRWDSRYAAGEYSGRTHPTVLLEQWQAELPRGRALDVACGAGRNALYLASLGYSVDAVDISNVALERGAASAAEQGMQVNWINADFDHDTLPEEAYDLVVVSRFLDHRLIPQIQDRLQAGGHVVYEQHVRTTLPDIGGPRSNRFRLRPQELLSLFRDLTVRYYYEGLVADPDGNRMALAQLVARHD